MDNSTLDVWEELADDDILAPLDVDDMREAIALLRKVVQAQEVGLWGRWMNDLAADEWLFGPENPQNRRKAAGEMG